MALLVNNFSPLYCRFNGFCLGAFLGGAQQSLGATRYGAIRKRVHEFLEEIDAGIRLPVRHDTYVTEYESVMSAVMAGLKTHDAELHDCCGVGAMAVLFAGAYVGTNRAMRERLRLRWQPTLQNLGLGSQAFIRFARSLSREAHKHDVGALVSQSYLLLADLLQPLPAEPDSCFVAMPFKAPFAGYFSRWYRPALRRAGFRAIRAWGGLGNEEYYPFIAPLIARCAGVLADLSTRNLNVVNEVGLAHGANCPTFLVIGQDQRPPPSNLSHLLLLQYDRYTPGWPEGDVARLAKFVRVHWRAYVASLTDEEVIHSTAHQLVKQLLAASLPVPQELISLARVQVGRTSPASSD